MVKLYQTGAYLVRGSEIIPDGPDAAMRLKKALGRDVTRGEARKGTITSTIIDAHNREGGDADLRLRFDSLTSHDITYVGIIQTARASGIEEFPVPYVMTNCHNSLCAVGGTINQDDHMFALSAAKKYGGIYVPPHLAVIHTYNREMMTRCGGMILGSDSHTRYGALGTMGVGEGGGELVKQLLGRTYDIERPNVVGVYLTGKLQRGVGAHDVALSIIGAVYQCGYVKNKVMEFVGDGVAGLSVECRNGIDVMTTETACWSSIWKTDERVREYYEIHGRLQDFKALDTKEVAWYDGLIYIDLATIEPTIAMPFHPSNIYTIRALKENAKDIFAKVEQDCMAQLNGKNLKMGLTQKLRGNEIYVEQGIIGGCAGGTFDNLCDVADMLAQKSIGNGAFTLSVYPGSQPVYRELIRNGAVEKIMLAGGIVRSAFCGPCFGAGDTPANGELSIRHVTRNFPNREGSKPGEGQIACVALMDAHSIAATALNHGRLTAATELEADYGVSKFYFDPSIYQKRVYDGWRTAKPETELQIGPNIRDWPEIPALTDHLLLKVVSYITDPVTTTDELIPSGETSSFRSNPLRLAEFTLSRKDPAYVSRAKAVQALERKREVDAGPAPLPELEELWERIAALPECIQLLPGNVGVGSTIYAHKPGDGSAREQAASCQRVLGAWANICREYATKRYRSNLINWGIVPFQIDDESVLHLDDYIFVPNLRSAVSKGETSIHAWVLGAETKRIVLTVAPLTESEREIIMAGCLINYYRLNRVDN